MGDAGRQGPNDLLLGRHLVGPVAEDIYTGALWNDMRDRREFDPACHAGHWTGGRQFDGRSIAGRDDHRGGMSAARISERLAGCVIDAIPNGEEPVSVP